MSNYNCTCTFCNEMVSAPVVAGYGTCPKCGTTGRMTSYKTGRGDGTYGTYYTVTDFIVEDDRKNAEPEPDWAFNALEWFISSKALWATAFIALAILLIIKIARGTT